MFMLQSEYVSQSDVKTSRLSVHISHYYFTFACCASRLTSLSDVPRTDAKCLPTSSLFQSLHALLLLLYKRDCRRQFAPKNHWIVREIKISFLNDVEKNKKWALVSCYTGPRCKPRCDSFTQVHRRQYITEYHTDV